jgi:hypothetical protein
LAPFISFLIAKKIVSGGAAGKSADAFSVNFGRHYGIILTDVCAEYLGFL